MIHGETPIKSGAQRWQLFATEKRNAECIILQPFQERWKKFQFQNKY